MGGRAHFEGGGTASAEPVAPLSLDLVGVIGSPPAAAAAAAAVALPRQPGGRLLAAVKRSDVPAVAKLLGTVGVDANAADWSGSTPLMEAVQASPYINSLAFSHIAALPPYPTLLKAGRCRPAAPRSRSCCSGAAAPASTPPSGTPAGRRSTGRPGSARPG